MDLTTAADHSLDLLKQLIAIPSLSRNEGDVADFLQTYMHEVSGLPVGRHNHNLWLIDPTFQPSRPTLLLNAHIDTVRPAASWQHDPFTPTLELVKTDDGRCEERLYGLGSNDDGASLVTLLHTFVMLVAEPDSTRNYNLVFLASAEEEVSGANGIDSVLNHEGPLSWLTHSPSPVVALVGEPTGMQPAVAEKGLVVLDGKAHGRSGHAARNEGINALYKAIDAVNILRHYTFGHESPALGPVKVTVTGIQAGTIHNVIPDVCTFMVDVRTTDAYTNEQVVAMLQQAVGDVELTPRSTRLQPSGIPAQHPLLQRIIHMGRQPFGSPTLSDQALMRFPSLKMGPGQSSRSHTADEYIRPDEIREALQIYYSLLKDLIL